MHTAGCDRLSKGTDLLGQADAVLGPEAAQGLATLFECSDEVLRATLANSFNAGDVFAVVRDVVHGVLEGQAGQAVAI